MKKLLLAFTFVVLFAGISFAQAQIADDKRQEIEKMLRLTGTEKLMTQMLGQMIASIKAQSPAVPNDFWVRFQQKLDTHQFLEKLMPLYDKYYTVDDLKAINAFYESAAGQKVLSSLPQIMQESMKIGQEWGSQIGAQASEEIKQEQAKTKK
jgi:hypothetical protein